MRIKKTSETRPLSATVVNEYNDSQENAYSCDYINKYNTYSTDEIRVGTWIDGKPIYRDVIDLGEIGSSNEYITKIINYGYFDTITSFDGYKYGTGVSSSLNVDTPSGWMKVDYYKNNANNLLVNIYRSSTGVWSDWSIKIIIEYTKTS